MGALVLGGLGYAAWVYLVPKPAVRIDSPVEGQTLAAGMPLQVWVSGEDFMGVESLTLSVDAASSNLVEGAPVPERFTFPAGTPETGTKVFTLKLKPDAAREAKTITLTATMKHWQGQTTTTTRVLKVGGTERSLVHEVNPTNPKPMQKVQVIVHAVNVPPGTRVAYSVEGTDGYRQRETLEVGRDGTIRYEVPGSFDGVVDTLTAEIEGTGVRSSVPYEFRQ
jgi:hypothetical protein